MYRDWYDDYNRRPRFEMQGDDDPPPPPPEPPPPPPSVPVAEPKPEDPQGQNVQ